MVTNTTANVSTPCAEYERMKPLWKKSRAMCGGEERVKGHDAVVSSLDNFLVPFSPSMSQEQYNFLKREAEVPGVSAEFSQLLIGGLLRKEPSLELPADAPVGAQEWITNEFGLDGTPLVNFMQGLVEEEIESTRGWLFCDYDTTTGVPYTTLYPAESVINWRKSNTALTQVILMVNEVVASTNEFHPAYSPAIYVHELANGVYIIRRFTQTYDQDGNVTDPEWYEDEEPRIPLLRGEPFTWLPIWPANGEIEPIQPFLLTIVNKEIALYNKITRRNHLLYGAATYTPYITGVDDDEEFNKIVGAGLGSWLKLPRDAKVDVLRTPTDALADLDRAVAAGFEELAKLGIRMLAPETAQSGIALQMRNASQTARLGLLNVRISVIMSQVIALMLNWRYGTGYYAEDIKFKMQDDFANVITGEGWLRLATEWYNEGLIPRSVWLQLLRQNDILPDDYNDETARKEIGVEADSFGSYSDLVEKETPNGEPTGL